MTPATNPRPGDFFSTINGFVQITKIRFGIIHYRLGNEIHRCTIRKFLNNAWECF